MQCSVCNESPRYCKCSRETRALAEECDKMETKIIRLRQFISVVATCPCCKTTKKCFHGCTFKDEWPVQWGRMDEARRLIEEVTP